MIAWSPGMIHANFKKKFTATPCPGNPTEGLECQNFMLKNGVFGVNPNIKGSKYTNLKI